MVRSGSRDAAQEAERGEEKEGKPRSETKAHPHRPAANAQAAAAAVLSRKLNKSEQREASAGQQSGQVASQDSEFQ